MFERDPRPGKPKILFVGRADSSHTYSWIDLLQNTEFDIRLFSIPGSGVPPSEWKVTTYLPDPYLPIGLDPSIRISLYSLPEQRKSTKINGILIEFWRIFRKILNVITWYLRSNLKHHKPIFTFIHDMLADLRSIASKSFSSESWLAEIIDQWKPDIIHTLGVDHYQGGLYFYNAFKQRKIPKKWIWIVQLRGGSDLTLNRHDPEKGPLIREILQTCDDIISDNVVNIEYAAEMGIPREKFACITPVPGTGGIDVDDLSSKWVKFPSKRERIILWPKAYDCEWSVALPVFEALQLCWDQIQPCKIYLLAMITPGTRAWYYALPEDIRQHCVVRERIRREEVIELMLQARVMLAPSLVDGIPNALYEAMACGAIPVVSPIPTISTICKGEENVIFARNLYPQEIAGALTRAMNQNRLVDTIARNNLSLVKTIADRPKISKIVGAYYHNGLLPH